MPNYKIWRLRTVTGTYSGNCLPLRRQPTQHEEKTDTRQSKGSKHRRMVQEPWVFAFTSQILLVVEACIAFPIPVCSSMKPLARKCCSTNTMFPSFLGPTAVLFPGSTTAFQLQSLNLSASRLVAWMLDEFDDFGARV